MAIQKRDDIVFEVLTRKLLIVRDTNLVSLPLLTKTSPNPVDRLVASDAHVCLTGGYFWMPTICRFVTNTLRLALTAFHRGNPPDPSSHTKSKIKGGETTHPLSCFSLSRNLTHHLRRPSTIQARVSFDQQPAIAILGTKWRLPPLGATMFEAKVDL